MSLPETMTCIEIEDREGAPLKLGSRPLPQPGPDEVLIKVAAAGINRPDLLQRTGGYPPPPGASDILGLEISGTVVAVGDAVKRWKKGDTVCALLTGGGYAEYATAHAGSCLPIPDGLSMTEAAALPETVFTVWTNVFERAALKAGESFLVHGGTSGIGTTAIQMATALGARVLATAGSDEKCQACIKLGAEKAVNYRTEDFVEAAKAFGPKGVDVILDMVGGDYIDRNVKALKTEGRLVYIAFLKGAKAEVNFLPVMLKRLTITGSTLRIQPPERKAEIAQAIEETIWPQIAKARITPRVHAAYALADAAEAHKLMESSQHIGKIVLTV